MLSCSFGLVRYSRYCLGSIIYSSIFCIAKDIIIRINMRMRCHPRGNVNPMRMTTVLALGVIETLTFWKTVYK